MYEHICLFIFITNLAHLSIMIAMLCIPLTEILNKNGEHSVWHIIMSAISRKNRFKKQFHFTTRRSSSTFPSQTLRIYFFQGLKSLLIHCWESLFCLPSLFLTETKSYIRFTCRQTIDFARFKYFFMSNMAFLCLLYDYFHHFKLLAITICIIILPAQTMDRELNKPMHYLLIH